MTNCNRSHSLLFVELLSVHETADTLDGVAELPDTQTDVNETYFGGCGPLVELFA